MHPCYNGEMRRRSSSILTIAVALFVVAFTACSSPDGTASEEATHISGATLPCTNPIDVLDAPPSDWTTFADVIALPLSTTHQRGRSDSELGRSFTKFGLVIRSDSVFSINIGEESKANALISWNNSTHALSLEVEDCPGVCEGQPTCPGGATGEWVVFPGGVWTTEPACISIDIETGGETANARLPIGVECS